MTLALFSLLAFGVGVVFGRRQRTPVVGSQVSLLDHLDVLDERDQLRREAIARDKLAAKLRDELTFLRGEMARHNGWTR